MDKEQIKKIINSPPQYNETEEDTMRSWFKDAYNKRMRWVMINFYVLWFILLVPIIISIIQFFRIEQTKYQIMYAAIFIFCNLWGCCVQVCTCVLMQRPRISRLEFRIAELIETIKNK
ncbi:MAG: DUF6768 family protein [Planctomycetota bacterium]|jgi:hypothetical protein